MEKGLAIDTYSSPLAERLVRRASGPIGVIDVRGAQQRYDRAASWPLQHVAMLERWVSRYPNEAHTGQGVDHVFAAKLRVALPPATDAGTPGRPAIAGAEAPAAEPRSKTEPATARSDLHRADAIPRSEVHTGPTMRAVPQARSRSAVVSRSAPPAVDGSAAPAGVPSSFVRPAVAASMASRKRPPGATALPLVSHPTRVALPEEGRPAPKAEVTEPSTSEGLNRSMDGRIAGEVILGSASRDVQRHPSTSTVARLATNQEPIHLERAARPATSSPTVFLQRRAVPATVAIGPSSTLAERVAPPVVGGNERRRAFAVEPLADRFPRTEIVRAQAGPGVANSLQPLVLSRLATATTQRWRTDPQSPEIGWRTAAASGAVVSRSGSPAIGGSDGETFLPAPPSTIARANLPEGGSSTLPDTGPAAQASGRRGAPDTSQITEQVTRRLLRQIAVERERRGGSHWP